MAIALIILSVVFGFFAVVMGFGAGQERHSGKYVGGICLAGLALAGASIVTAYFAGGM